MFFVLHCASGAVVVFLRPLELASFARTSAKSAKVSPQELQQNMDHVQVRVEVLLERISLEDGLIDLMKSFGAVVDFVLKPCMPLVVLKDSLSSPSISSMS